MKQAILSIFGEWSTQFEGRIPHMYLDVKGLVTIGIGNLIDPYSLAISLPFRRFSDGARASVGEIRGEWTRMKGAIHLAKQGHTAARKIATLYLTPGDIDELVIGKVQQFENYLRRGFPRWDSFPANAQLGIMSMAWAMGPGFYLKFPSFTKACNAQDWVLASKNCLMRTTNNPGLVPRNKANVKLFEAAAITQSPEILDL